MTTTTATTDGYPVEKRRRAKYPQQFRRDTAALVIDGKRTVVDVAKELGLVAQTVGNRVRQEKIDRGEREGLTSEERAELNALRREIRRLTSERDLLKKAMAFWVQESTR